MTLPLSPPISLQQILNEFSAPQNTPLTSLVRGGAYVPNTAANAGVPTAPPIGLLHFLGASAVTEHSVSPNPASMGGTFSNGALYSENCTAVVVDGIGPFTFAWSFLVNNFGFSLSNASSQTCNVSQGGQNNALRSFELQCDVIDTGNGNLLKSFTVEGSVTWGTPP